MRRHPIAVLSAAAVLAALGLSGCTASGSGNSPTAVPSTTAAAASPTGAPVPAPLPAPEALTTVLYRLADPAVPGSDKLTLVEGSTPDDAAILDRFSAALRDGGYLPMNFEATNIAWSDRGPDGAVAVINVKTPNPQAGAFSFPMEFKPSQGGWQLSKKTADMLLAFGNSHIGTPPPVPAPPR